MIKVKLDPLVSSTNILEFGQWLDSNMPNPPVGSPSRWSIGENGWEIRFYNDADATVFALRWANIIS